MLLHGGLFLRREVITMRIFELRSMSQSIQIEKKIKM